MLVTEDKGFGELIVHRGFDVPGLILVRYSQSDVWAVLAQLLAVVDEHRSRLHEMHVVVAPDRMRMRDLGSDREGDS